MSAPPCVLLTVDTSPLSETALGPAEDLARRLRLPLHVFLVVTADVERTLEDQAASRGESPQGEVERYLTDVADRVSSVVPVVTSHVEGVNAGSSIVDQAPGLGAVLIVMASHGHSGLTRHLVGGATERVMRRSPIPVVVTPADTTDVILGSHRCPPLPTETPSTADEGFRGASTPRPRAGNDSATW